MKGSIPVYVMAGASLILSLVGFIFLSTTKMLGDNVGKAQADIYIINNRATVLEANYGNIKDSVNVINVKLDKILNKF